MKKINIKSVSLLTGIVLLSGCGENAWNDHLDGFEVPPIYSKTETINYTLTADDYKAIASNSTNKSLASEAGESDELAEIGTNGYFSTAAQARKYIPAFVSNSSFPYFTLNNGSSLKIGYDLATNQPAEVVAINNGVKTYTVSEADYQEAWGSEEDFIPGFAPITPASANLAGILKTQFPDAVSGDYAVISYQEASVNPVFGNAESGPTVYIDESFAEGLGAFTIDNVSIPSDLSYVWNHDAGYSCMKASAYANKTNFESESWLVSPEIKLSDNANAILTFDQAVQYFADIETAKNEASINVRISGGAWEKLTVPGFPEKLSWSFVASGDIDLSAYNGKSIQIGFCYKSTASKAGTWEVNNVKLADGGETRAFSTRAAAAPVPTIGKNAIYVFNGSEWDVPGAMLVLQPDDYIAMGQSRGNLSGTLPSQLLPTYLSQTLPYAADDAAEIVAYKYYNGSTTSYKANQFTKTEGNWVMNNGATVDQFTKKDNVWQFNPSVEMTLPYSRNTDPTYTYFMACKDWVFANVTKKLYPDASPANGSKPGPPFIDYRDNAEFYSGVSAYYGNVDVRANTAKSNAPEGYTGYDGLTDDEISELVKKRFATETFPGALAMLHADAEPVAGMDVTYTYKFTAYTSEGAKEYTIVYIVTGKGEFTFSSCDWWTNGKPE